MRVLARRRLVRVGGGAVLVQVLRERLDGRLVVERRGQQRGRADQVARRDREGVPARRVRLGAPPLEVGGKELGTASGGVVDPAARAAGRDLLEVAVEVVDRQQVQPDQVVARDTAAR